jgi:Na+/H+ antiporter NhaD/arsenite permease-like protein
MMAILWAIIAIFNIPVFEVDTALRELIPVKVKKIMAYHLSHTSEILIFLLGAMTIVEIIDYYNGFEKIKSFVRTKSRKKLLWIFAILAFILSAIIDNLNATIVLITILQKIIKDKNLRLWFAGLIVIAANAGGAWSPIGDVTTTMLWINAKVSTGGLIQNLVLPSIICVAVPVAIAYFLPAFKGTITLAEQDLAKGMNDEKVLGSKRMLAFGLGGLIFVPVFKTITHLPPYVGMMLALGVVWLVSEYIHPQEDFERKEKYSAHNALSRIEMSSILFFLGILVAVAALESVAVTSPSGEEVGLLRFLADKLEAAVPNQNIVIMLLGVLSAVIDNVPLVAASMGMYSMETYPLDDSLWHFIAYSAGTGGSMLIIGSAAGVAAMGMERIDFIWYMKKISWIAALGFLAGAATFILLHL